LLSHAATVFTLTPISPRFLLTLPLFLALRCRHAASLARHAITPPMMLLADMLACCLLFTLPRHDDAATRCCR